MKIVTTNNGDLCIIRNTTSSGNIQFVDRPVNMSSVSSYTQAKKKRLRGVNFSTSSGWGMERKLESVHIVHALEPTQNRF